MGLDNDAVTFIVGTKSAGADFERTVTVGRQNFYPSISHLQRALAKFSPTRLPTKARRSFMISTIKFPMLGRANSPLSSMAVRWSMFSIFHALCGM